MNSRQQRTRRGIRTAQAGLLVNAVLVIVKVITGIVGHSYALVADGIESSTDVFASLVVWRGLKVSSRKADEEFHFGYGKAESLSAAVVALLLVGASVGIAIQAIREIVTPHHLPAWYTLVVLGVVVVVKEMLFRYVGEVADEVGSLSVKTDAWHHRSDAITSAAAFIGIAIALFGGPGWEPADDWAALFAACIIGFNGVRLLLPAVQDLMDRAPETTLLGRITTSAAAVNGVLATEKIRARRAGLGYFIDLHVQAAPELTLLEAHELGHLVKNRIMVEIPEVIDVIIHMEPYGHNGHFMIEGNETPALP